jgi:hypothetical protein
MSRRLSLATALLVAAVLSACAGAPTDPLADEKDTAADVIPWLDNTGSGGDVIPWLKGGE